MQEQEEGVSKTGSCRGWTPGNHLPNFRIFFKLSASDEFQVLYKKLQETNFSLQEMKFSNSFAKILEKS